MFNFLPKDYQAPKSSGSYMKIQKGENRIRILSQPVLGWEEWTKDMKPVRYRYEDKPTSSIDPKKPVRHFWSFIVWNYADEQIQILHVTQAMIRTGLETLCKDSDWGAPFTYDIKIFKEGEELKTKYTVNPVSHKPVASHIIQAFNEKPCCLEAILENRDPFSGDHKYYTKGMFPDSKLNVVDQSNVEVKQEFISKNQVMELEDILAACDPGYTKSVWDTLAKAPLNVREFSQLPANLYNKIKAAALKKKQEFEDSMPVDWIVEA